MASIIFVEPLLRLILTNIDGNRVAKSVNGVVTYYLVDDLNPTGYAQVMDELN